ERPGAAAGRNRLLRFLSLREDDFVIHRSLYCFRIVVCRRRRLLLAQQPPVQMAGRVPPRSRKPQSPPLEAERQRTHGERSADARRAEPWVAVDVSLTIPALTISSIVPNHGGAVAGRAT